MVNYNDEWNFELCRTIHLSEEGETSAKVKCDCSVEGFIGVGMVLDDTYVPNSVKEIFHFVQNVTFKYALIFLIIILKVVCVKVS